MDLFGRDVGGDGFWEMKANVCLGTKTVTLGSEETRTTRRMIDP